VILLRVPGTLEYRNLALRAVSEACRIAQHDEWEGASLEAQTVSALGEAFNNIAIHSYAGRPPGEVIVEISWTRDEIVMQITDEGQSFDPEQVALPDLDALPEGGMGLFIIRSFMDEVDYQAGPPNVLRLVKRRATRAEGEMAPMSTRSTRSNQSNQSPGSGSGPKGSSSGRSGSIARRPKGAERDSDSARSGWRMVAVDGGAATSLRKTGSAKQK
jgi:serine/threonine-protein kinase RsbW